MSIPLKGSTRVTLHQGIFTIRSKHFWWIGFKKRLCYIQCWTVFSEKIYERSVEMNSHNERISNFSLSPFLLWHWKFSNFFLIEYRKVEYWPNWKLTPIEWEPFSIWRRPMRVALSDINEHRLPFDSKLDSHQYRIEKLNRLKRTGL